MLLIIMMEVMLMKILVFLFWMFVQKWPTGPRLEKSPTGHIGKIGFNWELIPKLCLIEQRYRVRNSSITIFLYSNFDIIFQTWLWGASVDFGITPISDYFASQVKLPNNYGQGPTLTLEEQIHQKAKTNQPPMGLFPEGVQKTEKSS